MPKPYKSETAMAILELFRSLLPAPSNLLAALQTMTGAKKMLATNLAKRRRELVNSNLKTEEKGENHDKDHWVPFRWDSNRETT